MKKIALLILSVITLNSFAVTPKRFSQLSSFPDNPHFGIGINPLALIIKAIPVAGYIRTGIIVHQVRYCKFNNHNTSAFYNAFPLRGSFDKVMSFSVNHGYEADYMMKFLLGGNGGMISDDGLIGGMYAGFGYQIARYQLNTQQYWAADNATPWADYFVDAAPTVSLNSIQAVVGFLLMKKKGILLDLDMAAGGRTRTIDFNTVSPVSGEEITPQNTTFKDDHLIIPDTWKEGHYYRYLSAHIRVGFSF